MRHFFVTLDAPLHGYPAPLERMSTPVIPLFVGESLPVDFRVVTNVQRVDSEVIESACLDSRSD